MRGSGTKLADVLKRSGLAASVTDAKRIADDISSTERKVQNYFDSKKNEMYNDLVRRSTNVLFFGPLFTNAEILRRMSIILLVLQVLWNK